MIASHLGYFAHVSTLEDIQENVEDYIPVTARPIAMYNDHVTVWSSVFLDVERTLPIKTYKWFPFKFTDLSMSMEEFKNKSKVRENRRRERSTLFPLRYLACESDDFHCSACSQSSTECKFPSLSYAADHSLSGQSNEHSPGCSRRRYSCEASARILAQVSRTSNTYEQRVVEWQWPWMFSWVSMRIHSWSTIMVIWCSIPI